ncbi:MAG: radical SAM protein [Nanoarchaeota archaeon]|nr:radical SAM protein [Nanoarchaeota archaeon]MBU1027785.1 radical SAM protein [Nanoarchaeota archaeon]
MVAVAPLKNNIEKKFKEFLNKPGIPYEKRLLKCYSEQILNILSKKCPPPYEIEIEPASRCNAGCLHCFGRQYKKCDEKLYSRKNMDRVIEQVLKFKNNKFNIEVVKFCGSTGEPLLNPQTIYAIEMFSGEKILRLFTNGILLGKNKNNFKYLKSISKINKLDLSLDVGTTKTLELTKPGSKKSKVTVKDILESVKKIKDISDSNLQVEAGYVITNYNYSEIIEATKKVKDSHVDLIRFRIDLTDRTVSKNHGDKINFLLKQAKSYEDKNFKVIPVYSESEIKSTDSSCFSSKESRLECFVSKFWTCIGPDGNIYPCGHVVEKGAKNYGNILEKDIWNIWEGKQRQETIKNLPGDKCKICSPFSFRANDFMTFLSNLPFEKSKKMVEYFKNPKQRHLKALELQI